MSFLREGWSTAERAFTWSIGTESVVELPPIADEGTSLIVQLLLRPFVVAERLPFQRLELTVNGKAIGACDLRTHAVVEFELPATTDRGDTPITLTLGVPNAAVPRPLNGAEDDRVLGICLERIIIRRLRPEEH